MALIVPDNILKLLQQFSFKVDPVSPNEDLTCNKCEMLIKDVYQSYCGCTYCRECIIAHLTDGDQYCNGNREDCKNQALLFEGNVSRNSFLNNKILKVKVICPNDSCLYSGYLEDMEDHLHGCLKQSIECPYVVIGCSDESCFRDTIENHINDNNIAHTQLLMDWVNQFRNENKSEIESIKENLNLIIRKYDREIETLMEDSRSKETQIERQRKEIESLKESLKIKETKMEAQRKDIDTHKIEIWKLKTRMEAHRKDIDSYRKDIDVHRKDIDAQKTEIWTLKRVDEKIEQLLSTIDAIKERIIMSGEIIFSINGIDNRMKTAEEEILSPYFYSHNNGYKLQLSVCPGGCSDGSGTHLSVFIHICRGKYDDLLPWPCKYSFHMSVINQRSGAIHNTMTINNDTAPENCKNSYDRPISDDNFGDGYYKFISHSDLRIIDGIIINNRIIIKCIITLP